MASHPIYQFYAELVDAKPKIWRRFQVANNVTMARLGYILMSLYEMKASHLFSFDVPIAANFSNEMRSKWTAEQLKSFNSDELALPYRNLRLDFITEDSQISVFKNQKVLDVTDSKMKNIVSHEGDQITFTYDFGDNWNIILTLEKIIIDKELPGRELPRVLEGQGFGIIEDAGGVSGLEAIAQAYQSKMGPQYEDFRNWLGRDDLDLDTFDLEDMNFRLKKLPRIFTDIYEYRLAPTPRSIDLLERKYMK